MATIIKAIATSCMSQQTIDSIVEFAQTASLFALGFLLFAFLV